MTILFVTHDSVRPFITLRIIKDNIRLAKESDAVDTVVEAVDTIVESTNGEYISNIPIELTIIKVKHLKASNV